MTHGRNVQTTKKANLYMKTETCKLYARVG